MKLLSIQMTTLTVLGFASRAANQIYRPMLLRSFLDRYHFVKYPENISDTNDTKFVFSHGIFEGGAIETFEVYPDGFVVGSQSNSDFLDAFTADTLEFLRTDWGTTLIQSNGIDRMYQSTLVVESQKALLAPLESAATLASNVQKRLAMTSGLDVEFSPFGFTLSADQATISAMRPSAFKIERRMGIEFQFNQFFTVAPLRTNDHLALLEDWEKSV